MKVPLQITAAICGLMAVLAAGLFSAGCASSPGSSSAPKPGKGIAEYRQITLEAHQAVAAAVKSLERLKPSPAQSVGPSDSLVKFDKSFAQLEIASVKARARAEAIIARGQSYFDEWRGNLSSITNQAVAKTESAHFDRLFDCFLRVRLRSAELREEFHPFMMKLRVFRARLDHAPAGPNGEFSQQERDGLVTSGGKVLKTLESISAALDDAETELQATLAAKR